MREQPNPQATYEQDLRLIQRLGQHDREAGMGTIALIGCIAAGAVGIGLPSTAILVEFLKPRAVIDKASNHLSIEAKKIDILAVGCRTDTLFAVDGALSTSWVVKGGVKIPGGGDGVRFGHNAEPGTDENSVATTSPANIPKFDPRAKVKMLGCVDDASTTVVPSGDKTIVTIDISKIQAETSFDEASTSVVDNPANKSFTEGLSGLSKIGSAVVQGSCDLGATIFHRSTKNCEGIDFNKWDSNNHANLERILRWSTLKAVQTQCAPQLWDSEKVVIKKSYQEEAVAKGQAADSIVMKYVDKNGKVTTAAPTYTKSLSDKFVAEGLTLPHPPGVTSVKPLYNTITCDPSTMAQLTTDNQQAVAPNATPTSSALATAGAGN